jgi:hypothetical protein
MNLQIKVHGHSSLCALQNNLAELALMVVHFAESLVVQLLRQRLEIITCMKMSKKL